MIVDLDGYQVNHQPFIVREMGVYSLQHGSFSWFLENKLPYLSLEKRDRKTVNYVYHHIHGLRFESSQQEKALPQHMVKPDQNNSPTSFHTESSLLRLEPSA